MTKRKSSTPASAPPPPGSAAAYAQFWCVHLRTAQRWLAEPGVAASPPRAALDDPALMVAWFARLPTASQAKSTRTFRARIDLFRLALERGQPIERPGSPPTAPVAAPSASAPPPPGGNTGANGASAHGSKDTAHDDPDYTAFMAQRAAAHASDPKAAPTTLASLKLRFEFADYKVGLAQRRGLHAEVREWTDTAARLAGVIHDEELRAQKLGREAGDILPRAEAARLLRALPFWLLRAVDDLLATLAPSLAATFGTGAPVFPEEVRAHLEPPLLRLLVLTPFTRAAQVNAGIHLPEWAVAEMRAAAAATLEDGAKLFAELYQTPPTRTIPLVTSGPTTVGPSATAAPSVSATEPPAAGAAISSATPDLGSGAAQTA